MPDRTPVPLLEEFLAGASVQPAVFALRPDYRAVLVAVDGLVPGPSDAAAPQRPASSFDPASGVRSARR